MNTSYRIVELVKRKISTEFVTASYTDVAGALRVSRAAISSWKTGRDVMSQETLERAQELLKLPNDELLDYSLGLALDAAPGTKLLHAAHRWMRDQAKRLPIILIAVLGVFGAGFSEVSRAASVDRSIHYAKLRRRWPVTA